MSKGHRTSDLRSFVASASGIKMFGRSFVASASGITMFGRSFVASASGITMFESLLRRFSLRDQDVWSLLRCFGLGDHDVWSSSLFRARDQEVDAKAGVTSRSLATTWVVVFAELFDVALVASCGREFGMGLGSRCWSTVGIAATVATAA